jgi:hypothetical protein
MGAALGSQGRVVLRSEPLVPALQELSGKLEKAVTVEQPEKLERPKSPRKSISWSDPKNRNASPRSRKKSNARNYRNRMISSGVGRAWSFHGHPELTGDEPS